MRNLAKKLEQWKTEGILEEKLEEYGFFDDSDDSSEIKIQEDSN